LAGPAALILQEKGAYGEACNFIGPFSSMRWLMGEADAARVRQLSQDLDLPPLVARLLVLRGLQNPEQASRFLSPQLNHLHDPFLMQDMSVAVNRLQRAIALKEKILIYGDYDVDGAMAAVVLMTALNSLGAQTEVHIPHRLKEGYGMRSQVIELAAREGCRVVISVDTGIREHEVLARARALGMDCIVTDHHLPAASLPEACAILNPRRADCHYPEKNLSGVGVAFKLVQALMGHKLSERGVRSYLKIVALGSIADVVPLTGENRVIAYYGLEGLSEMKPGSFPASAGRTGLSALLSAAGLDGKSVSASDVAFRIAPRLNAAGRMQSARDVIDLFTDPGKAREIAERLESLNRHRQQAEEAILDEIKRRIEQEPARTKGCFLVFAGEGWHRGVIGIVAQRLVDLHFRPALVIAIEDGVAYGSGRSIPGFHLLNALDSCKSLFERFGGHAQAVGFSLAPSRIPQLEESLEVYARTALSTLDFEPMLRVDAELSLAQLTPKFYQQIQKLAPFGYGNPLPVLASRVDLVEKPRILKEKHLRIRVEEAGCRMDAIGWGMANKAELLAPGKSVEIAYTLMEDDFGGKTRLQLVLRDLRWGSESPDNQDAENRRWDGGQ